VYLLNQLFPLWLSQWITWYFIVVFSGIGLYLLVGYIFRDLRIADYLSIAVGVAYMLSSYWIFSVLQDPIMAMIFYPIYPIMIYAFLRLLEESKSRLFNKYVLYIIILVFFLFPEILTPYIFILIFTLVYFSIVYFVTERPTSHSILNQSTELVILIVLLAGLFAPFLGSIYDDYVATYSSITSSSTAHQYVSTLYGWLQGNSHGFFYSVLNTAYVLHGSQPQIFGWSWFAFYTSFPFFILINAGWPSVSFSSLIYIKKIKSTKNLYNYYIGFLILALIGIFLQAGTAEPTGPLYTWLFFHFPPIRVFDTLNLWYSPILYLSYGALASFTIYGILTDGIILLRRHSKRYNQRKLTDYVNGLPILDHRIKLKSVSNRVKNWFKQNVRVAVVGLVIIWLLVPAYPLMNGMAVPNGFSSARIEFPSSETNTAEYLNVQNGSFRVISLPVFTLLGEYNYSTGGYYGTPPLDWQLRPGISYIGTIYGLSGVEPSSILALVQALYLMNVSEASILLNQLGISYVVITGDYYPRIATIMEPFSIQRTILTLDNISGTELAAHFGDYLIYHITTSQLISAEKGVLVSSNLTLYGSPYSLWPTLSGQNFISNISYSNFGQNYTNAVLAGSGLNLYFNYSSGITSSSEIFTLTLSPEIFTNRYGYLMINLTKFYGTKIDFQILNESGSPIPVQYNIIQNGLSTSYILNVTNASTAITGIEVIVMPQSSVSGSKSGVLISNIVPFYILNKYNWYSYQLNSPTNAKDVAVVYGNNSPTGFQNGNYNILSNQYKNPTELWLRVAVYENSTFVLIFKDIFSPGWILTIDGKTDTNHVLANGFMNGWIVSLPPGNYTFKLIYEPQKKSDEYVILAISAAILYGPAWAFLIYIRRAKK
jgi:hypothetical protein